MIDTGTNLKLLLIWCECVLTFSNSQETNGHQMEINPRLRSHGNDIVPLSYRSDFWKGKVDCSHDSGPLSYQFWDLFTRVRYGIVPKHFAPKQAKENQIYQQISNTAE